MIFSVLLLVMIAAVAFFHYIQGMFSATLSAVLAMFAAMIALSYYEPLTNMLLGGKFADTSHAMSMVALFAGSYLFLRILFDKIVPGNLRLPVLMDKIGAGVMGAFAGCIGAGVFAIALQTMPFGMTIAGYSPYELEPSKSVQLMMAGQQRRDDMFVNDAIKLEKKDDITSDSMTSQSLIIPVDSWVAGMVYHLSDKGSLAGQRTLDSVHPKLLDELFFSRVGITVGRKVTAVNTEKDQQITVYKEAFQPRSLQATSGEVPEIRPSIVGIPATDFEEQQDAPPLTDAQKAQAAKKAEIRGINLKKADEAGYVYLVVRIHANADAASDAKEGSLFSFSTGSIWLVVSETDDDGKVQYEDVHPIGTLMGRDSGGILKVDTVLTNVYDDFLFTPQDKSIDLVFRIKKSQVSSMAVAKKSDKEEAPTEWTIKDGTVLVVKRLARMDISGMKVNLGVEPAKDGEVLRKDGVYKALDLPLPGEKKTS